MNPIKRQIWGNSLNSEISQKIVQFFEVSNGLDTRTKREKDVANQHQKGEHQRHEDHLGGHHRTTLSRSSRSDAVRQPDNSDTVAPGKDNDLTTYL